MEAPEVVEAAKDARSAAEDARSAAEDARETKRSDLRLVYRRIAILIALPVAFIALIPAVVGLFFLDREIHNRCVDGSVNRDAIRGSIERSLGNLGYRLDADTGTIVSSGKPPLDYYVTHPAERRQQVEQVLQTLTAFPKIECPDRLW